MAEQQGEIYDQVDGGGPEPVVDMLLVVGRPRAQGTQSPNTARLVHRRPNAAVQRALADALLTIREQLGLTARELGDGFVVAQSSSGREIGTSEIAIVASSAAVTALECCNPNGLHGQPGGGQPGQTP